MANLCKCRREALQKAFPDRVELEVGKKMEQAVYVATQPCTCGERQGFTAYYNMDDIKMTTPYDIEGRILKRCPDCTRKYSEPEKSKCDHIVGVQFGCEECGEENDLVSLSDIGNRGYRFEKFYFCPKQGCGVAIDWDAIGNNITKKL